MFRRVDENRPRICVGDHHRPATVGVGSCLRSRVGDGVLTTKILTAPSNFSVESVGIAPTNASAITSAPRKSALTIASAPSRIGVGVRARIAQIAPSIVYVESAKITPAIKPATTPAPRQSALAVASAPSRVGVGEPMRS